MEQTLQQLKEKIKQRKKGQRWKPELREEIVNMAKKLYQEHKNWRRVATILEIKQTDLYNLRAGQGYAQPKEESAFAIAIIQEEEQIEEKSSSEITLKSPNGFQLQGLSFHQAIKAMEVLSCSQ